MDIESINKYLNKKVVLALKSGYNYKGQVTKIYNSSFDFIDCIGNELSIDVDNVSLIMIDKSGGIKR